MLNVCGGVVGLELEILDGATAAASPEVDCDGDLLE
jgi:hypothetical protein